MPFEDYAPLNSLCDFPMIAGEKYTLIFDVFEEDGVTSFDLTGYSTAWLLAPFGNSQLKVLQKDGVIISTSEFKVTLSTSDTVNLGGKYIQQPVVIDSEGQKYYPSQGRILIQRPIAN